MNQTFEFINSPTDKRDILFGNRLFFFFLISCPKLYTISYKTTAVLLMSFYINSMRNERALHAFGQSSGQIFTWQGLLLRSCRHQPLQRHNLVRFPEIEHSCLEYQSSGGRNISMNWSHMSCNLLLQHHNIFQWAESSRCRYVTLLILWVKTDWKKYPKLPFQLPAYMTQQ